MVNRIGSNLPILFKGGTVMNEFVSLSPSELPEEFDVELYSEKPVVSKDILVTPAQEQATDQADETGVFEDDTKAYGKDAPSPADTGSKEELIIIGGDYVCIPY